MEPVEMKDLICKELDEHKAVDITVLDVAHLTVLTDYFVICTAKSNKQVKALAEFVDEKMSENGVEPTHTDGMGEANGRCSITAESSCISSTTKRECSIALKNFGRTAEICTSTSAKTKTETAGIFPFVRRSAHERLSFRA